MQKILFRVDSSIKIGSGHLMRCLTLANKLKDYADIYFIVRALSGNWNDALKGVFPFKELPLRNIEGLEDYEKLISVDNETDALDTINVIGENKFDTIIVDNYALGEKWENMLRPFTRKIMVIDDLANRKHNCDILLDQNSSDKIRYKELVPSNCKTFLGIEYVLLREEFYKERQNLRIKDGTIKNIFVFFGGSDETGETLKTIEALSILDIKNIKVNVVVGKSNENKDKIKELCLQYGFIFHLQIDYMARLMSEGDIAIGAGGSTTWERVFLGLSTIVIAIADNQTIGAEKASREGYIDYMGESKNIYPEAIAERLNNYFLDSNKLLQMNKKVLELSQNIQYGNKDIVNAIIK